MLTEANYMKERPVQLRGRYERQTLREALQMNNMIKELGLDKADSSKSDEASAETALLWTQLQTADTYKAGEAKIQHRKQLEEKLQKKVIIANSKYYVETLFLLPSFPQSSQE